MQLENRVLSALAVNLRNPDKIGNKAGEIIMAKGMERFISSRLENFRGFKEDRMMHNVSFGSGSLDGEILLAFFCKAIRHPSKPTRITKSGETPKFICDETGIALKHLMEQNFESMSDLLYKSKVKSGTQLLISLHDEFLEQYLKVAVPDNFENCKTYTASKDIAPWSICSTLSIDWQFLFRLNEEFFLDHLAELPLPSDLILKTVHAPRVTSTFQNISTTNKFFNKLAYSPEVSATLFKSVFSSYGFQEFKNKLTICHESTIEGKGVELSAAVEYAEVIGLYQGAYYQDLGGKILDHRTYSFCLGTGKGGNGVLNPELLPLVLKDLAIERHINHSCSPNTRAIRFNFSNSFTKLQRQFLQMPVGETSSEILHACAHPWLQAPDNVRCDAAVLVAAQEDMAAGLEITIDYEGSCRLQVLPHSIHQHSAGFACKCGDEWCRRRVLNMPEPLEWMGSRRWQELIPSDF